MVDKLDPTKDIGTYKCMIKAGDREGLAQLDVTRIIGKFLVSTSHETEPQVIICIADRNDTFIDIIGDYELEVNSKQPEAIIKLEYLSYPPIESMMWRDVHGTEIPWSALDINQGPTNEKFDARRTTQRITLTIRDLVIADAGEYALQASNGRMKTEKKIMLRVRGNFESHLAPYGTI